MNHFIMICLLHECVKQTDYMLYDGVHVHKTECVRHARLILFHDFNKSIPYFTLIKFTFNLWLIEVVVIIV